MDELISRQAAIDEGMSYINGDCFCDKEDFAKYIEFIEQLPPIQPAEPKLVKCDYVKACNKVTMNKTFSAWAYLAMLNDFEECGYVLVDMRER